MFQQQHDVSDKARQSSELGPTKKEKKNDFFMNYWQFALSKYLITKKAEIYTDQRLSKFHAAAPRFCLFHAFPTRPHQSRNLIFTRKPRKGTELDTKVMKFFLEDTNTLNISEIDIGFIVQTAKMHFVPDNI